MAQKQHIEGATQSCLLNLNFVSKILEIKLNKTPRKGKNTLKSVYIK